MKFVIRQKHHDQIYQPNSWYYKLLQYDKLYNKVSPLIDCCFGFVLSCIDQCLPMTASLECFDFSSMSCSSEEVRRDYWS